MAVRYLPLEEALIRPPVEMSAMFYGSPRVSSLSAYPQPASRPGLRRSA